VGAEDGMKVLVIESGSSDDFFDSTLEGVSTHELLKRIGIDAELRFAVDNDNFGKALERFATGNFDVMHISAHGSGDAIHLTNDDYITWKKLAELFQRYKCAPNAMIMTVCFAGSDSIDEAFQAEGIKYRPGFVFGSKDARYYYDYVVAWAILYRMFYDKDFNKVDAKIALQHISAVVDKAFVYRRWASDEEIYKHYPTKDSRYEVMSQKRKED
jgi:hypothetical protein